MFSVSNNHHFPITTVSIDGSNNIADEISLVAKAFKEHQSTMLPGTGGLELIETTSKRRYFGVQKEAQCNLDFQEVRSHILHQLGLPSDTQVVQVIGDSGRFSPLGTQQGKEFLETHLQEQDLILWGYTGKGSSTSTTCEVNQLVTNWLESNPRRFNHALANVVDVHTPLAIGSWGCSASSQNRNFYVVYNDALFGSDIESSDKMTNKALCLNGGIQSMAQIKNFLLLNIRIIGIYNMRGENNPDTFHEGLGQYLTYFTAGEFIDLLQKEVELRGNMTAEEVEQFKDAYLDPKDGPKRHLFNPSRKDASTKQALWDTTWSEFMKHKLWHKLHLCAFKNVGV